MQKLHKFKKKSYLANFRAMSDKDVPAVTNLLNTHLATYKVHISFSEQEVKHFFLPEGVE